MSSQSTFRAFGTRQVPRVSPALFIAKINASSPESLWVQRTPFWHREAAMPLLSSISFDRIFPVTTAAAYLDFDEEGSARVDGVEQAEKSHPDIAADMTKHQNLAIVVFDIRQSIAV